jgi:hypothetical protein
MWRKIPPNLRSKQLSFLLYVCLLLALESTANFEDVAPKAHCIKFSLPCYLPAPSAKYHPVPQPGSIPLATWPFLFTFTNRTLYLSISLPIDLSLSPILLMKCIPTNTASKLKVKARTTKPAITASEGHGLERLGLGRRRCLRI